MQAMVKMDKEGAYRIHFNGRDAAEFSEKIKKVGGRVRVRVDFAMEEKAVNNHKRLVGALRIAQAAFLDLCQGYQTDDWNEGGVGYEASTKVRDALAAVEDDT